MVVELLVNHRFFLLELMASVAEMVVVVVKHWFARLEPRAFVAVMVVVEEVEVVVEVVAAAYLENSPADLTPERTEEQLGEAEEVAAMGVELLVYH